MQKQGLSTPSDVIEGVDSYLSTHGFAKFKTDLKRIKYICEIFATLGYSHLIFSVDFVRIHTDDSQHSGFDDFIKGVKNLCAMSLSQKLFQEGSPAETIYTAVLSQTRTEPHSILAEALRKATGTVEYINRILRENDVDNHIGATKKDSKAPLGLVFSGTVRYKSPTVNNENEQLEEFSEEACELFESKVMRVIFDMLFADKKTISIDNVEAGITKLGIEITGSLKKIIFEMKRIIDSHSNRFELSISANCGILGLKDHSDNAHARGSMSRRFVGDVLEIATSELSDIHAQAIKENAFMGANLTRDELIFCILIERSENGMSQKDFNPYLSLTFSNPKNYLLRLMSDINSKFLKLETSRRVSMIGLVFSFCDDADIQLELFAASNKEPKRISLAQFN